MIKVPPKIINAIELLTVDKFLNKIKLLYNNNYSLMEQLLYKIERIKIMSLEAKYNYQL